MNVNAVKKIVITDIISVKRLRLSCTAFSFSFSLVSIATNLFSISLSDWIDCCMILFIFSLSLSNFSSILSILWSISSNLFSLNLISDLSSAICRLLVCICSSCSLHGVSLTAIVLTVFVFVV